jgi:predicted dehydrogenase
MGAKASLSVGDMKKWSYDGSGEQSWTNFLSREDLPVKKEIPFELQVKHLIKVVRGKEAPVCSGEDGLKALMVCKAVKRSLKEGRPVSVEEVSLVR